jgi:hypothetical protein
MVYEVKKGQMDKLMNKIESYVNKVNPDKRICYVRLEYNDIHDKIDCNIFWDRMTAVKMLSSQMRDSNLSIKDLINSLIGFNVDLYVHYDNCR